MTKCKATIYFHALDKMIGEMVSRCNGLEEVCSMFGFLHLQRYSACSTEQLQKQALRLSEKFPSEFSVELGCELSSFQQILINRSMANDIEGQSQGVMPYLTFIVTTDQCDVYSQLEIELRLFLIFLICRALIQCSTPFKNIARVDNVPRQTVQRCDLNN